MRLNIFLGFLSGILLMGNAQETEKDVEEDEGTDGCCSVLFVSATGILAEKQSSLLGKYKYEGVDQRNNSIFYKMVKDSKVHLYLKANGTFEQGSSGWTIGNISGNSFYISTRNTNPGCPEGITGAYDRDVTLDSTFNIECHSDEVRVDCCPKISILSAGIINKVQGAHMGDYIRNGSFNGYPMYTKSLPTVFSRLFFQKHGLTSDGWIIGNSSPEDRKFSITTRSQTYCPNEISTGYNLDEEKDDTFQILCSASVPLENEKDDNLSEQLAKIGSTTTIPQPIETTTSQLQRDPKSLEEEEGDAENASHSKGVSSVVCYAPIIVIGTFIALLSGN